MAGLWVLTVIATITFCALVAACIVSVILYVAARRRNRKEGRSGRRLTVVNACAPFLGLLWLAVAFLIHVQISNRIAHQDCGLSSDPYVTLPNGYVVGSLNTYDGYFVAPGFKTDLPVMGPGYVRSLIDLKYSTPNFAGTMFDVRTSSVRNFIHDTRTQMIQLSNSAGHGGLSVGSSDTAAMDAWAAAQTHVQQDRGFLLERI